ncbi:uncharacterized protein (TIRG00374 family) [Alkalihalobacillus xiaoxiensis]|uniref:Phosphatidylglycerol lysyltransferase n=1 Tax=Shouchella xiaoxiensis TaxID=766895 RepID=A0ABS2SWJ0_9BACI|nr:lysylphosphatidylglycerol synthase transmembrane domain-containing protein [Shouchella xiaoxiensis]MBM7838824.1 uncharacterized protein (TIRG00374 family) [Shouchella xiaoxiensis]
MDKKSIWQLVLVFAIGAASIWYFSRSINFNLLWNGLKQADMSWLFLAFIVVFLTWVFEALALLALTTKENERLPFKTIFYTTMIGQLFNQITPLATGGQPAQLYVLVKRGVHAGRATSILVIKFLMFQVVLVASFSVILLFAYSSLAEALPNMHYLILIGYVIHASIIVGLLLVVLHQRLASFLARTLLKPVSLFSKAKAQDWRSKLDGSLHRYHEQSRVIMRNKTRLLLASLLTCAQLLFFFSLPFFIFQAFHVESISLFISTSYHAFIMMFASVVPTPGGSGAAEFTFNGLFRPYMSAEQLVLSLLFWRVITAYLAVFIGVFLTGLSARKKRSWKQQIISNRDL